MENITAEQIAQHYKAMGDSVDLINAGQPEGMTDEEWADCLSRNVEHLKIMVAACQPAQHAEINNALNRLHLSTGRDDEEIVSQLQQLIPEFEPTRFRSPSRRAA